MSSLYDDDTVAITDLQKGELFLYERENYIASGLRDKHEYNVIVFKDNATHEQVQMSPYVRVNRR